MTCLPEVLRNHLSVEGADRGGRLDLNANNIVVRSLDYKIAPWTLDLTLG